MREEPAPMYLRTLPETRSPLLPHQLHHLPREYHPLPRPQLGALAGLDFAVDTDEAFAYRCVSLAAGAGEAGGLEELVELDVVATNGETDGHGESFARFVVGIIAHADAVRCRLPMEPDPGVSHSRDGGPPENSP